MAEREEISGSAGTVGHEGGGRKSVRDNVDPLRQAAAIDWWQEQRWSAREFCQCRDAELRELARTRIDALPLQELIWETSSQRKALELEILAGIQQAEVHLASELEHVLTANPSGNDDLTGYSGWSGRDLSKLALGGSGTAAVATVAARASPGLLGMLGLGAASAVAAPLAVTVGAAVFAWSAASVVGGKRQAYLQLVQNAVTRLLVATDSEEGSVLSRHLRRLDEAYKQRIENAS
ncbi:hypothetical protein [Ruixingdingia sedimenti]|uniref:Uncharacterized protein n=1 Tax=Ruixingdingia sedimenti TaxID=3073604 RepID=A0ABU1FG71_9RHOB|nr:hypothetical protein [Xinfangfangia sp. LG-4]MDR5655464.1 hypothetical protein [Xinfangfangia sp. LG-4]